MKLIRNCSIPAMALFGHEHVGQRVYMPEGWFDVATYDIIAFDPISGKHQLDGAGYRYWETLAPPLQFFFRKHPVVHSSWDASKAVAGAVVCFLDTSGWAHARWEVGLICSIDPVAKKQLVQLVSGEYRTVRLQHLPTQYIPPSKVLITHPGLRALVASPMYPGTAHQQQHAAQAGLEQLGEREETEVMAAAGTGEIHGAVTTWSAALACSPHDAAHTTQAVASCS